MHRPGTCRSGIRIALASALLGTVLGGCSTIGGPLEAMRGPSKGAIVQDQTIALAEAAALGSPRDPALRARLGSEYLSAGRFASAAASFADAVTLGDTTPTTTLRLSLALIGSERGDEAAALLFDRSEDLPAADLGLALALTGEVQPAVRFMEAAIRDGENSAALRQNLALAYALAGRWREARLMAALDVSANALGARMERWATLAMTGDTRQRLAMVLRVPAGAADAGVPVGLALAPAGDRIPGRAAAPARAASGASAVGIVPVALASVPSDGDDDHLPVPALFAPAETMVIPLRTPEVEVAEAPEREPAIASNRAVAPPLAMSAPEATSRSLPAYLRRQHRSAGARW